MNTNYANKKYYGVFFLVTVFLFFSFYTPTLAQARDSDVSVAVNPETPGPNQDVILTLTSFAVDLDKAQISWRLNSQLGLLGIGRKSFTFKTGESGNPSTIDVNIALPGFPSLNKRIIIQPGEVDLLWEATDSFVPPFYRGKALLSSEGEIRVTAVPNIVTPAGVKLADADFSYNWKRNFKNDQGLSGYGKRSFTFKNSYLEGAENIDVSVSSVLGNYNAEGKVSITPGSPKIVFYEKDPFSGIKYNKAIVDGFTLQSKELQITAVPYFFSTPSNFSDLKFGWSINNSSITTPVSPNNLIVEIGSETGGSSKISLLIENLSRLFQTASTSLLLNIPQ